MGTGLTGKVVSVTTASGDIGGGMAKNFAAAGAPPVLHYYNGRTRAQELQRERFDSANQSRDVRNTPHMETLTNC
jgi:NAD(P)-dependent dehydrogenase (short-subunit alcohol dehydrogenase family)